MRSRSWHWRKSNDPATTPRRTRSTSKIRRSATKQKHRSALATNSCRGSPICRLTQSSEATVPQSYSGYESAHAGLCEVYRTARLASGLCRMRQEVRRSPNRHRTPGRNAARTRFGSSANSLRGMLGAGRNRFVCAGMQSLNNRFAHQGAPDESGRLWQPAALIVIVMLSAAILLGLLTLAWLTLGRSGSLLPSQ